MLSAFGVEHGLSKGFRAIRPKLAAARTDELHFMPGSSMNQKLRHHYTVNRTIAGDMGPGNLKQARHRKDVARRIAATLSRQGREKRVLP